MMNGKTGMMVMLTVQDSGPFTGRKGTFRGTLKNYEGQEYHCRSLSIHVPVGNGADCLYFRDDKIEIASHTPSWNLFPDSLAKEGGETEEAVCTLDIKDGGVRPLKDTVEFTLSGNVNSAEGTVLLTYTYEYSADGGETWETGSESFVFEKKSSAFYLRNLFAAKPDSPVNYCTEFAPGEKVFFSWESNGTLYEIYKKGKPEAVYAGTDTHYTCEEGIDSDTTFLLKAVRTENGVNGEKRKQEMLKLGTHMLFETITLTTSRPVLQSVKVLEELHAEDARVSLLHTGVQVNMGDEESRKIQVTGDGFLTGHLLCSGETAPSSAYIRLSVYRDGKERYTARECAFCADIPCAGNRSIRVRKPANVMLPVNSKDTIILESGMENPSGKMTENGYETQWFFVPAGKGEVSV